MPTSHLTFTPPTLSYPEFAGRLEAHLQSFDNTITQRMPHLPFAELCKLREVIRDEAEKAIKEARKLSSH